MSETETVEVWLWQALTGGRIHISFRAPDGVHHSTVCGYLLPSYVRVFNSKPWHQAITCVSCRRSLKFIFPTVQDTNPAEEVYGELYQWREDQERNRRKAS